MAFILNQYRVSYNLNRPMSAIVCSLSGSPLSEGVVSSKTGHIFQKSTILRHILAYGTCPHTKQPLSESDLIALATNNKQTHFTKAQYADSDKIIAKIQAQYQTLLLEAHYLKNSVKESRQELAQSLYRQDASIRVIAKLQEEVELNRRQIARLVSQLKGKEMQQ